MSVSQPHALIPALPSIPYTHKYTVGSSLFLLAGGIVTYKSPMLLKGPHDKVMVNLVDETPLAKSELDELKESGLDAQAKMNEMPPQSVPVVESVTKEVAAVVVTPPKEASVKEEKKEEEEDVVKVVEKKEEREADTAPKKELDMPKRVSPAPVAEENKVVVAPVSEPEKNITNDAPKSLPPKASATETETCPLYNEFEKILNDEKKQVDEKKHVDEKKQDAPAVAAAVAATAEPVAEVKPKKTKKKSEKKAPPPIDTSPKNEKKKVDLDDELAAFCKTSTKSKDKKKKMKSPVGGLKKMMSVKSGKGKSEKSGF